MAISDYLNKLIQLKNDLVANLNAKSVTATEDEKFNTLVPKVLEMGSDATATAEDIASGKTAYIASGKVTGTKEETEQNVVYSDIVPNNTFYSFYDSNSSGTNKYYCNLNLYIKELRLPEGIVRCGVSECFNSNYFPNLETLIFPEGFTTTAQNMCNGSLTVKKVVLPRSLTLLNYRSFANCSKLKDIYYRGTEEEWAAITKREDWRTNTSATIHYNYTG